MNASIFNKKTQIVVHGETGSYPHTNNCFHVTITVDGKSYDNHFLPKEEYRLAQVMKANLSQTQIDAILPEIENYGQRKYSEASDDAAMEAAENDI